MKKSLAEQMEDEKWETMDIHSKEGDKVTVTEQTMINGYFHDQKKAEKYLTVGEIYTVDEVSINDWNSWVRVKELPDEIFNTVHFVNYKG